MRIPHSAQSITFERAGFCCLAGVSGDIVKLMFDIQVPDDPELGDCSSERMWVIVHERSGLYYIES